MDVAFISNDRLGPAINWSTLGPPVRRGMADLGAHVVLPQSGRAGIRSTAANLTLVRRADVVFWMQLSARPEWPVAALALAGRRRSAYVLDAWPYVLPKIAKAAKLFRLDPCFVAFEEAAVALRAQYPSLRVEHLPFGVDTDAFRPNPDIAKDVFVFSMGRRHEPLHAAIEAYCAERGLTYVSSQGGRIASPQELGAEVARARYFVVTTPDVDHPQRAGGFSPFVMRYLEGLASGTRLVGTRPRSGELEKLGLADGLLEVAADGSDLAAKFDADIARTDLDAVIARLCSIVRTEHSWAARAATATRIIAG